MLLLKIEFTFQKIHNTNNNNKNNENSKIIFIMLLFWQLAKNYSNQVENMKLG